MKNAEEILRKVYNVPDYHNKTADLQLALALNMSLDSVIQAMHEYASQSRWVKVSERLPEKGERVLCNSIYGVQIGWLTIKGDWQFTNGGSQISITHWQPLPSLPTASKD